MFGFKKHLDRYYGISWVGLLRFFIKIISFFRTLILARLLLPEDFGVFAVAVIILSLFESMTEIGTNVFLIQQKTVKETDKYINTAWTISIIRGIFISLLIFIIAPYVSNYFNFPGSEILIRTVSLVPLIKGFLNPSISKFQKEIKFFQEFKYKLPAYFIDAGVAVIFAFITKNPTSLVYGLIAGAAAELILSFKMAQPIPNLSFDLIKIRLMIKRGKWLTFTGIFDYLFQNIDDFVVGKLLYERSLGLYQVAHKISSLPTTEVSQVFGRVAFPVYKKLKNNRSSLIKTFYAVNWGNTVFVLILGSIIIAFPERVILILLGENWLEAESLLQVLAVYGILKAIFYPMMHLFLAFDKQEYNTYVALVGVVGLAATIVPFTNAYGVIGAAYSTIVGILISIPLILFFVYKLLKTND